MATNLDQTNAVAAPPVAGGPPSPPPATPLLTPEQLAALSPPQGYGPLYAAPPPGGMPPIQVVDPRLSPPAQSVQRMLMPGGNQTQPVAPPPAQLSSPPPAAQRVRRQKFSADEEKAIKAWTGLADHLVWIDPKKAILGTHAEIPVHRLPQMAQDLLKEMYPEKFKEGLVPLGWSGVDKLPYDQQAVLAQLSMRGQAEQEERYKRNHPNEGGSR